MKRYYLLFIFTVVLTTYVFSQSLRDNSFVPVHTSNQTYEIIEHQHYMLSYNENAEQPYWVAYALTANEVTNRATKRKDNFRPDNLVSTGSARLLDYKGSGYDRGHLAPSADFLFSRQANSETFFMSNMSPQAPQFNRGIWKKLESLMRYWAFVYDEIYIVTAGVLDDNYIERIGAHAVAVPKFYYKAVYIPTKKRMVGFLLPNKKSALSLTDVVVSIDTLELRTSLDFFKELHNEALERDTNIQGLLWNVNSSVKKSSNTNVNSSAKNSHDTTSTIKKSRSDICHDTNSSYYSRVKHYIAYNSMKDCLASGGRLPK